MKYEEDKEEYNPYNTIKAEDTHIYKTMDLNHSDSGKQKREYKYYKVCDASPQQF